MKDYQQTLSQMTSHALLLHFASVSQQVVADESFPGRLAAVEQFPYIEAEVTRRMEG